MGLIKAHPSLRIIGIRKIEIALQGSENKEILDIEKKVAKKLERISKILIKNFL